MKIGDLPNFVVIANISDGDSTKNRVQVIMSNNIVWHKTCRSGVDNQNVQIKDGY